MNSTDYLLVGAMFLLTQAAVYFASSILEKNIIERIDAIECVAVQADD